MLAVAVGVVLGAVVGQPGSGGAATTAVPKNKTLPKISGEALVGTSLIATRGTWTGSPTSFRFAWNQCDATGAACLPIPGANGKVWTVTNGNVGHTLRVTVTARNADGSGTATSTATTVVPTSGCRPGTGPIQIAQLFPPARLAIGSPAVTPSVTRSSSAIHLHFQVTACGGRAVQGATVYAVAVPYNQFAGAQAATAADGTVTLSETRQSGFPAGRHQRLLAVFVRATKPGEQITGGVSTRLLVSFHIHG